MLILTLLLIVFAIYNLAVYHDAGNQHPVVTDASTIRGKQLWQEHNCTSCHQLYGLGGYLGPDLTNVYSASGKGPQYIKAMLNSGVGSMPRFQFTMQEKEALVAFLAQVDQTGHYPNYNARVEPSGWVAIQYKHEQ